MPLLVSYYHPEDIMVDTSAAELLDPEDNHPVVSVTITGSMPLLVSY